MQASYFLLNDQLVMITADPLTTHRLNQEACFLAEYLFNAAERGQLDFLFAQTQRRRVVVRKVPSTFIPVWGAEGGNLHSDIAAMLLLLKFRGSEKFASRFREGNVDEKQLWNEISTEMILSGYDVDGRKCCQKFRQLTQSYQNNDRDVTPEMRRKLKRILEQMDSDDEECLLKKSSNMKKRKLREVCERLKRRNKQFGEKLNRNRKIIDVIKELMKE